MLQVFLGASCSSAGIKPFQLIYPAYLGSTGSSRICLRNWDRMPSAAIIKSPLVRWPFSKIAVTPVSDSSKSTHLWLRHTCPGNAASSIACKSRRATGYGRCPTRSINGSKSIWFSNSPVLLRYSIAFISPPIAAISAPRPSRFKILTPFDHSEMPAPTGRNVATRS